jgi:prepilin-type N-terminal cleavage/methylation domain-containing protein
MKKKMNIFYIKNQKGFSLIEMMVVVVILGLIVLGLVTFFTGGAKSWVAGQSQLKAQREARQAIDIMVREVREGKNVKTSSASNLILFITPFNGSPDIKYHLSNGTLYRNTTNAIIDNILNLSFTYFDNNGKQICDVYEVPIDPLDSDNALKASKVHIYLQVDVDKDGNPDVTLNTDVNLRNYGLQ